MRKSVIFIISIISLISIVIVSFFGVVPQNVEDIVYIQSLEITNDLIEIDEKGNKTIKILDYEPNTVLPDTIIPAMEVRLGYKYFPENVTPGYQDVSWHIEETQYANIYKHGSVLIKEGTKIKSFKVTLFTNDKRGIKDDVNFIVKYQ